MVFYFNLNTNFCIILNSLFIRLGSFNYNTNFCIIKLRSFNYNTNFCIIKLRSFNFNTKFCIVRLRSESFVTYKPISLLMSQFMSVFKNKKNLASTHKLAKSSESIVRRSRQRFSVKKGVLKHFPNFTEKFLCWSLFLIKLQVFRCFPVKFVNFLSTLILKNICE